MGRHGGGSSSGGSRGRSGGSSSSGSSVKTSKEPFRGCYRRRWYSRGRYHTIYTSDMGFGTRSGWSITNILIIGFLLFHMSIMMKGVIPTVVQVGQKISGDINFIAVEDKKDLLTDEEEQRVETLFKKIYDKSGMPIMLYTDNYDYKNSKSIETYSEEIYYNRTMSEDAMVILFTTNLYDSEPCSWDYDMYCGDDTIKCFSDAEFDIVLENFQKAMYQGNLADALEYSWNLVIDDLAETEFVLEMLPLPIMLLLFYGVFFGVIFKNIIKNNEAYKYFKKHPYELTTTPYDAETEQTTVYTEIETTTKYGPLKCDACGAINTAEDETCRYCGAVLTKN